MPSEVLTDKQCDADGWHVATRPHPHWFY